MRRLAPMASSIVIFASCVAVAEPQAQRVVSLDYCADQYVLRMLPASRVLAVSPDADKPFSYMRAAAVNVRKIKPLAENILSLKPDLVVRSYGGGPRIGTFLNRAGVDVLQLPYSNNLSDIRNAIQIVAEQLGVPETGAEMVAEMDARMAAIAPHAESRQALYMTPTGVTSGTGTLIHEMLQAAGLENFEQGVGWRSLPLEPLAYRQPDVVAAAFFDDSITQIERWSAMRHPVAKQQLRDRPTVFIQGAWTSCGAWFLVDAIEALAKQ